MINRILVIGAILLSSTAFSQETFNKLKPADKGGGSTGVGSGGDAIILPNGKVVFLDLGERVAFFPSQLKVYPSLKEQFSKLEAFMPVFISEIRSVLEEKDTHWFFSMGELKSIDDENSHKSPIEAEQFKNKRQAAYFNGKEIFVNQDIFEKSFDETSQKFLLVHEALRAAFFKGNKVVPESAALRKLTSLIMISKIDPSDLENYWDQLFESLLACFEFTPSHLDFEDKKATLSGLSLQTKEINRLFGNNFFISFILHPPSNCKNCQKFARGFRSWWPYAEFLDTFYDKEKSKNSFSSALGLDKDSLADTALESDPGFKNFLRSLSIDKFHKFLDQKNTASFHPQFLKNFYKQEKLKDFHFSFFPIHLSNSDIPSDPRNEIDPYRIYFGVIRYGKPDEIYIKFIAFFVNVEEDWVSVFQIGEVEPLKTQVANGEPSLLSHALEKSAPNLDQELFADGNFIKVKTTPQQLLAPWSIIGNSILILDNEKTGDSQIASIVGEISISLFHESNFFENHPEIANRTAANLNLIEKALQNAKKIRFRIYPDTVGGLGAVGGNNKFLGRWNGVPGNSFQIYPSKIK